MPKNPNKSPDRPATVPAAPPTLAKPRGTNTGMASDLRGVSQLIIAAVSGVTDVVEGMHRNIAGVSPILGTVPAGRAKGISGLVYGGIRGVTRAVGLGLDLALALVEPLQGGRDASPRRDALVAAINGTFGDYLVASGNPLAIAMSLRRRGQTLLIERRALAVDVADPQGKLVVLVHGLCMNDLQWDREGHDHGAVLARELGYTPVYLHYNSGRHISSNGHQFADIMESLLREWPVPVSELVIVGHSMGGLVARSACHYARLANHAWPRQLRKLVFLGTPHHGAPLERVGNRVDLLAGVSPYTEPLSRLGKIRSAGIKDLRHGSILDEDWYRGDGKRARGAATTVPLPEGVECYAIAATRQERPGSSRRQLRGDGLVPVDSALGRHENAALALPIPAAHQAVCYGLNHFDLLGSREVCDRIRRCLAPNQ
jgi:pimeloyl-ACP methyl ester carboxylesterase